MRSRRAGRVPLWLSLGLCLLLGGQLAHRLGERARASGLAEIDARRYTLLSGNRWFCTAWEERLGGLLAGIGTVGATDREAILDLAAELEALSFVAEVGTPEVLWPDGMTVPLRLRTPVACLRIGEGGPFLPVSEDAVVLDGVSSAPHEAYGAWLPVLAAPPRVTAPLRAGDALPEGPLRDAHAVCLSLWSHLSADEVHALGRVLVDATAERAPDGLAGGVVLDLEQRRRVLFGRPPGSGHPGELPVELKWRAVSEGLALERAGSEWAVLDVRWDRAQAIERPGRDGSDTAAGH